MKLFVVDTETSDLPERGGQMLELAWLELVFDQKWKRDYAYETYIQYEGPIDPRAHASHHIDPSLLLSSYGAITRVEAIGKLVQRLQPDSFLVAHNAEFDNKFLPELQFPWICTLRAARHIWPEAPGFANQVLRYWLNITPDLSHAPNVKARYPHQAFYDVATTAGILMLMLEKYSPAELHKLSTSPIKMKTMTFGKYKGTEMKDVPRDYLQWLKSKADLSPDLRYSIDSILNG